MCYTTNHDVLVQDMVIRGEGVKVQTVILISFLIGFILNFIWALIMEIRQAIKGLNASAATRLGRRLSEQVQDARDLMAHGLPKEAEVVLRGILEQRADHSEAMTLLGDCLLREGDPQAAALQLAHACETHPDHAEPRYLLAEARQALRDPDGAAAVLRQLASDQPKQALRALRRLRALHLEAQRWDEALEVHKRLGAQFPSEMSQAERAQGTALQYQVGLQKVEADQFKEAAQTFQALLKEDPSFVPAYLYLGRCMILQDQEAQGIEIWLEGFRATSEGALLQEIEDYYIQLGLPEDGIAVLRRVAATSEHEAMAKFFLGKMLYRLEILDEALDIFQEVKSQVATAPCCSSSWPRSTPAAGAAKRPSTSTASSCATWARSSCASSAPSVPTRPPTTRTVAAVAAAGTPATSASRKATCRIPCGRSQAPGCWPRT